MTGVEQCARRPPRGRWRPVVCVLGVLLGLLAMHGLGPGALHTGHAHERPMAGVLAAAHDPCSGDGHCGGHVRHADATCASAAVSGGPVLPAPVADRVAPAVPEDSVGPYAAEAPDGARAPPSLAELQLLRI